MTRNRGAAIIVQEGKIALIKLSEKMKRTMFLGGGIEEGETPEEATKRKF
ncbi:NUDIX domain-containing protein [Bacillus cereus]